MKIIIFLILSLISVNPVNAKEKVIFNSCVDGDTFHVTIDNEKQTIRMIAIDTPETVHPQKGEEPYGKQASEYTCNKVKNAKKIEIEYDENSDKTDKYGRIIAWVFVDDILLQKELIENGYAKVGYLYDDYKYTHILEESQELASINNIGIWSETTEKKEKTDSQKEIIIIVMLVIIILFSSNKKITKKAKIKLKKYLKR